MAFCVPRFDVITYDPESETTESGRSVVVIGVRCISVIEIRRANAAISAAVESWVATVREIDVRTWGALTDTFDDRLTAQLAFSLGKRHRLVADFDLGDNFVLVKWVGRRN